MVQLVKELLYEKNAHLPLPMASTTKVMTALLGVERLRPHVTALPRPTLVNAIIDPTAGTESGRITSLNPTAGKKK